MPTPVRYRPPERKECMECSARSPAAMVAMNAVERNRGLDLFTNGPPDSLDKIVGNKITMSYPVAVSVVIYCRTT